MTCVFYATAETEMGFQKPKYANRKRFARPHTFFVWEGPEKFCAPLDGKLEPLSVFKGNFDTVLNRGPECPKSPCLPQKPP